MGYTIGDRSKDLHGNGAWANYVMTKRNRANYTCRIDCEGECYYLVDGQQLSEQEFNNLFPIGLIDRSKGERLDSRQRIF